MPADRTKEEIRTHTEWVKLLVVAEIAVVSGVLGLVTKNFDSSSAINKHTAEQLIFIGGFIIVTIFILTSILVRYIYRCIKRVPNE